VPGNGPGAYWPGRRYVDWVGTDFFANSPNFRRLTRFYRDRRWRRKPFAFGEWPSGDVTIPASCAASSAGSAVTGE
jgi:hypothetical protein